MSDAPEPRTPSTSSSSAADPPARRRRDAAPTTACRSRSSSGSSSAGSARTGGASRPRRSSGRATSSRRRRRVPGAAEAVTGSDRRGRRLRPAGLHDQRLERRRPGPLAGQQGHRARAEAVAGWPARSWSRSTSPAVAPAGWSRPPRWCWPPAPARRSRRSPDCGRSRRGTTAPITSAKELPRRLLVLGGGAVGAEMAQAFRRLGCEEVTVVEGRRAAPRPGGALRRRRARGGVRGRGHHRHHRCRPGRARGAMAPTVRCVATLADGRQRRGRRDPRRRGSAAGHGVARAWRPSGSSPAASSTWTTSSAPSACPAGGCTRSATATAAPC